MRLRFFFVAAGLAAAGAACGHAPAASSAPAASPAPAPAQPEEAAPEKTTAAPDSNERKPRDIITDPDMTFVLAFDSCDAGKAAEEKCTQQSKGDSKKLNQCMATARDKIAVDAIRFKQDDEQNWWWQSLRRRGTNETMLHKVQVEFGEETERSIVLKTKGRDTGTTPWARVPAEVQLAVPNSFSISMKDPQHGTLVYEGKILLSDNKK